MAKGRGEEVAKEEANVIVLQRKKWEQMLFELGFLLNLPWINTAGTSRAQQQHEFLQNSAEL